VSAASARASRPVADLLLVKAPSAFVHCRLHLIAGYAAMLSLC
jgi:hypothetical protein